MTTIKAYCGECGGERNHTVLHTEESTWTEEQDSMTGVDIYQMLKCSGCESVKLRVTSWDSESKKKTVHYYPPTIARPEPDWVLSLDLDLWMRSAHEDEFVPDLLHEIYAAHNRGLERLATMGVRSLIERIMVSKVGDNGSFSKNLDEFVRLGYVSDIQKSQLNTILEAGHAVIHRAYTPTSQDVSTLLDITEQIVQTLYMNGDKVAELKKRVPPRSRRGVS